VARVIDLMEPTIKSGSGDPQMLSNLSPWYLKGFHMPEYKQPFSNSVTGLLPLLLDSLLENRHLHFELADIIFQEEHFFVFCIGVSGRKAF